MSFCETPDGLCRLALAYSSKNLGANCLSVGTSIFGLGGPCCSRCRSRSSPHLCAADFDVIRSRRRSRYRDPSDNLVITSTIQPPRLYGLTVTLIATYLSGDGVDFWQIQCTRA